MDRRDASPHSPSLRERPFEFKKGRDRSGASSLNMRTKGPMSPLTEQVSEKACGSRKEGRDPGCPTRTLGLHGGRMPTRYDRRDHGGIPNFGAKSKNSNLKPLTDGHT